MPACTGYATVAASRATRYLNTGRRNPPEVEADWSICAPCRTSRDGSLDSPTMDHEGALAMDSETVDREYAALQQQAQQTAALIQTLAGKLSAAAGSDSDAREWQLDLKEIALAVRDEENAATSLLQAIHSLVDNHVQTVAPAPQPEYQQPPVYQQPPPFPPQVSYVPPQYQPDPYAQPGGGALHRFLGSNFGRAIVTGAGFGIGDDLINDIFGR
jgi:hypothetical protein